MPELTVMNPSLYGRLKKRFGHVVVSNPHQKQQTAVVVDPLSGKQIPHYLSNGETYRTSCPFCGDTRFRLWVNYLYGQPGPDGRPQIHLARCFNETDCLKEYKNRLSLRDMIDSLGGPVQSAVLREDLGHFVDDRDFEMPGTCVPINGLERTHEAVLYLRSRGFCPETLWRNFRVTYCEESDRRFAHRRIVSPVYLDGEFRGWQARPPFEAEWNSFMPKYFSCPGMKKSRLLYNFDLASKRETVVVVEGVADAWSFGAPACASFGASLSDFQQDMLVTACTRDPDNTKCLILLYDPEAYADSRVALAAARLKASLPEGKFAAVKLPAGTDPGSLYRPVLRHIVALEAARQGVAVSWKKSPEVARANDDFE